MHEPVTVAAVQLNSQDDLEANLARVRARLHEAAERGAALVVLPENFAFMGDEARKAEVAEDLDQGRGPVASLLSETARTRRMWIVAGGMAERAPDPKRPYNTCAVYSPSGEVSARYRKVHLFDVDVPMGGRYRESESTTAGGTPVVAEAAGVRLGLSVCYDLRFPELYRALSTQGAEALVVPAAFTLHTGKDHWHVLLRARAIEAQAYVIAAAQWGKHPKNRQTYGKSCVIDPWGEVIAQAKEGEGIVTATIDPAYLQQVRASLPALTHRRL